MQKCCFKHRICNPDFLLNFARRSLMMMCLCVRLQTAGTERMNLCGRRGNVQGENELITAVANDSQMVTARRIEHFYVDHVNGFQKIPCILFK